jgi:membrane protease YdiL (CAAX protease family)
MDEDSTPEILSTTNEDAPAAEPPLKKENSLWVLLAAIAAIWTCTLLIQVGGFGAVMVRDYLRTGKIGAPPESLALLLSLTYIDWFAALCIAYFVSAVRLRKPLREAFALKPISARVALQSFILGVGGAIAAALLLARFGTGEAPIYDIAINEKEGVAEIAIPFILLAVLVPPLEELYYRGFIFPILRSRLSAVWAVIVVALWFGLLHVAQLWGEWLGIVIVILLGTIWTLQRHRYDSLYPSIISHWTYNISIVITQALAFKFQ